MLDSFRSWTETLSRKPLNAAGFAFICTIIPFTEWVAWVWLALCTLRLGWKFSVWVIAAIILGILSLQGVVNGMWELAYIHIALLVIPLWIFSLVLQRTVSLNITLQSVALVIFVALLLSTQMGLNDPQILADFLRHRLSHAASIDADLEKNIQDFASLFMIYWPSALFCSYLFILILARWWQAGLDNPGGFKREFHALRLNFFIAGGALVCILLGFWAPNNITILGAGTLAASLLVVAGLGLAHCWVQAKQWSNWVLVGIYIGIFLLAIVVVPLLAVAAAVDSAADLRKRLM